MTVHSFTARTFIPRPVEEVFAWHERPGAFERLAPPWAHVRVVEREGGIRNGARVVLEVSRGPLHVTWTIRHRDYQADRQFRDEQISGPLHSWVHTHRFLPADGEGRETERDDAPGTLVVDDVEWQPPMGSAGELFAAPTVEKELRRLFRFRHRRLANDLELHGRYRDRPRLTVAISGASGLIGSALGHFLTSGGHRVIPMVRDREDAVDGAVYWNWREGEIDAAALGRADAVVHLAGEPIAGIRWTEEKKREIWESRVKGTELIAQTMAGLHDGPSTLVSGSAVDYYGDRGDEVITEDSAPGSGFLADVCRAWEGATKRARGAGIRVVRVRTGFILSPAGGALGTMLLPFKAGLGGRLGKGRQYVPWIDLDDEVGILHHALMTPDLSGPLNLCAPHPVPNATFTGTLGRVLGRPTVLPVPKLAVKALFGEMGEELLLQGQRARPERVEASGYAFLFQGLEESLRFQLGRAPLTPA